MEQGECEDNSFHGQPVKTNIVRVSSGGQVIAHVPSPDALLYHMYSHPGRLEKLATVRSGIQVIG